MLNLKEFLRPYAPSRLKILLVPKSDFVDRHLILLRQITGFFFERLDLFCLEFYSISQLLKYSLYSSFYGWPA